MIRNVATVYFAKCSDNAVIPTKRAEDAAFDIYTNITEPVYINPHETKMLPTGLVSACSPDYCFILKERGSTGTKGMAQRCGVIDSGYRGEWFIPITNTTDNLICLTDNPDEIHNPYIKVYPTSKAICQAMIVPVPKTVISEISLDEINAMESERGTGALGSSNK